MNNLKINSIYYDDHGNQYLILYKSYNLYFPDKSVYNYTSLKGNINETKSISLDRFKERNYSDILTILQNETLYLDDNEFNPILSLDNITCVNNNYKIGECYFNKEYNKLYYIYYKYKHHFIELCNALCMIDIEKIEIQKYFNVTQIGYTTEFLTDFNNFDKNWIKVPKIYFDMSIGLYTFDETQNILKRIRRNNKLNKIFK